MHLRFPESSQRDIIVDYIQKDIFVNVLNKKKKKKKKKSIIKTDAKMMICFPEVDTRDLSIVLSL